jgi:hypothetical protein
MPRSLSPMSAGATRRCHVFAAARGDDATVARADQDGETWHRSARELGTVSGSRPGGQVHDELQGLGRPLSSASVPAAMGSVEKFTSRVS